VGRLGDYFFCIFFDFIYKRFLKFWGLHFCGVNLLIWLARCDLTYSNLDFLEVVRNIVKPEYAVIVPDWLIPLTVVSIFLVWLGYAIYGKDFREKKLQKNRRVLHNIFPNINNEFYALQKYIMVYDFILRLRLTPYIGIMSEILFLAFCCWFAFWALIYVFYLNFQNSVLFFLMHLFFLAACSIYLIICLGLNKFILHNKPFFYTLSICSKKLLVFST